jgi:hypothetical protein
VENFLVIPGSIGSCIVAISVVIMIKERCVMVFIRSWLRELDGPELSRIDRRTRIAMACFFMLIGLLFVVAGLASRG